MIKAAGGRLALGGALASLPFVAFAQQRLPGQRTAPFTATNIYLTINNLTNILFVILIGLAVIFFIVAAFKYLTSGGDAEKVKSAHNMLIYGVVATAVAIIARGLVFLATSVLG